MTQAQLLTAVKLACRIYSTALDDEISDLITAAFYDLEISGIADTEGNPYTVDNADQLVVTAIKTYVKINLGDLLDEAAANRLTKGYWDQKAQLKMRVHSDSTYVEPDPGPES